jgi:hypothetical protein
MNIEAGLLHLFPLYSGAPRQKLPYTAWSDYTSASGTSATYRGSDGLSGLPLKAEV